MKKILFSSFIFFFGILLFPQVVGAAGSCCVYIAWDGTSDLECADASGNSTGVNVDTANEFACPSGSVPATIAAGFFVYEQPFTESACKLIGSNYHPVLRTKGDLYCKEGIEALRGEPEDSALAKAMDVLIGNSYAVVHNVIFGKSCCLPIDKQTYPNLSCKLPKLKIEISQNIYNYFFEGSGIEPTPPSDATIKDYLTCDPDGEKYQVFPLACGDTAYQIAMESIPTYYQKAGFPSVTMQQLCTGSFSYSSPPPEDVNYLPADKTDEGKKETETKTEEEQKIILPSAAVLNQLPDTSPQKFLGRMVKFFLGVIGSLALAITVIGGFLWMTSMGNAERRKKAQAIILWSFLGVIVMFSSYALLNFIFEAVE